MLMIQRKKESERFFDFLETYIFSEDVCKDSESLKNYIHIQQERKSEERMKAQEELIQCLSEKYGIL